MIPCKPLRFGKKMKKYFKYLNLFIVFNVLFVENSNAVTLTHVVNVGFVEAGFFLFGCGILLLFVPKLTKLGIIVTLIGNAIVVSRFLFQPEIMKFLEEKGFESYLSDLSNDDLRLYTGLFSVIFIMILASINFLRKYLWLKFWRIFGFYRTDEEIKASEDKRKRKAESKKFEKEDEFLKKTIGYSSSAAKVKSIAASNVDDVFSYDRDISLDLDKASSIVHRVDSNKKN